MVKTPSKQYHYSFERSTSNQYSINDKPNTIAQELTTHKNLGYIRYMAISSILLGPITVSAYDPFSINKIWML